MSKKDLTEKHKEFARLLFEGKLSKLEAYRKAFKDRKLKDESAQQAASRLSKNVKVRQYIDELNAEVNKSKILSKQEILEYLSRAVQTPVGSVDSESDLCQEYFSGDDGVKCKMVGKLQAIQELNKLLGHYEPEKVETSVSFLGSVLCGIPAQPLRANE